MGISVWTFRLPSLAEIARRESYDGQGRLEKEAMEEMRQGHGLQIQGRPAHSKLGAPANEAR